MAFTYKILTKNGVNNTNIDGARAEYFAAGMRDGIIKGSLNECEFTAIPSNGINLDTGVLLVAGHPVVITEGRSWTFTSRPSNSERRAVIAEIAVDNNSAVSFRVFEQLASIALVKNNMYEHENGSGTYQVEIGRFTLTTSGLVEDVVRTLDLITGGSSGMGEHFVTGNITTTMLESGMKANVTAQDVYDANGDYKQTDMNFEFPETAGTVVTVNNIEQANLSFTSDPQTQLNNKVDKETGKGLSTEDYTTAEKIKLGGIEAEANKTIVDSSLSSTSENPLQNKIVKNALDAKADANTVYTKTETDDLLSAKLDTNDYIVDSALSNSSDNPVQNKIITNSLNKKVEYKGFATGSLNNVKDCGIYNYNQQGITDIPAGIFNFGVLIVINGNGTSNDFWIHQILIANTGTPRMAMRSYIASDGFWGNWYTL